MVEKDGPKGSNNTQRKKNMASEAMSINEPVEIKRRMTMKSKRRETQVQSPERSKERAKEAQARGSRSKGGSVDLPGDDSYIPSEQEIKK